MTDADTTTETFLQRAHRAMTEAYVAERRARSDRHRALAAILRVESYQVRTVIDLDGHEVDPAAGGTYVVEYAEKWSDQERVYWGVVHNGKRSATAFYTRPYAILHALAVQTGNDDGYIGATYAGRTLGLAPDDAGQE